MTLIARCSRSDQPPQPSLRRPYPAACAREALACQGDGPGAVSAAVEQDDRRGEAVDEAAAADRAELAGAEHARHRAAGRPARATRRGVVVGHAEEVACPGRCR